MMIRQWRPVVSSATCGVARSLQLFRAQHSSSVRRKGESPAPEREELTPRSVESFFEFIDSMSKGQEKRSNTAHHHFLPTTSRTSPSPLAESVRHGMRSLSYPVILIHTPPAADALADSGALHKMNERDETEERDRKTLEQEGKDEEQTHGAHEDQSKRQHRMLASSFTTVSLEPDPIVSFNIKLPSRTYESIVSTGRFTASALWDPIAAKTWAGYWKRRAPWQYQAPIQDELGTYLEKARIWALDCVLLEDKTVQVGDHVVVFGRVEKFLDGQHNGEDVPALIYCNGNFRKAGAHMESYLARQKEQKMTEKRLEQALEPGKRKSTPKDPEFERYAHDVDGESFRT